MTTSDLINILGGDLYDLCGVLYLDALDTGDLDAIAGWWRRS